MLETGEHFGAAGEVCDRELSLAGLSSIRELVGTTRSLFSMFYLFKFLKIRGHLKRPVNVHLVSPAIATTREPRRKDVALGTKIL